MKKAFISVGFSFLFAGFLFVNALAQQPAPVNFVVFEEMVSPSDMAAFGKVQQQAVDLWKKHKFDVPIYCYGTDDNIFYWVIPIENFGSIDGIFAKSAAITKKMKDEDGFDGDKAFRDLSSARSNVIRWSPDLSYHVTGNMGQSPDKNYVEWSFCSLKQGHEAEAAAAIKKYIEFYKKENVTYEWDIYMATFGMEMPTWIITTRSESPAAIRKQEDELYKKYSKELDALWNEFILHVRKIDNKTGWYKQNWSINTMQ
jgi:hypothetical protein